jgi:S-layer homology domain
MFTSLRYLSGGLALLTIGIAASTSAPVNLSSPALAQETAPDSAPAASFPDIQNHWARPFIEALAEKDIVAGYPDGTYQPDRTVKRDELAAIIRQAFEEKPIRQSKVAASIKMFLPAIGERLESNKLTKQDL